MSENTTRERIANIGAGMVPTYHATESVDEAKAVVEQCATATERLRELLDERGVEWWQSVNMLGCVFTRWYSPLFSDEVVAMENGDGELELFSHLITPEQAIAATLGVGTCYPVPIYSFDGEFTEYDCNACSACGTEWDGDMPNFCPNCGRKVVDE